MNGLVVKLFNFFNQIKKYILSILKIQNIILL